LTEVWHPSEFLYHTWHPGQAGDGNYLGPHDGRHMSTTALEARTSGRVLPLLENPAIAALRSAIALDEGVLEQELIGPDRPAAWASNRAARTISRGMAGSTPWLLDYYKGYNVVGLEDQVFGVPCALGHVDFQIAEERQRADIVRCASADSARGDIDAALKKQGLTHAAMPAFDVPVLVLEGYKGFNIVRSGTRFYGIPQGEGEFNLARVEQRVYSALFVADTEPLLRELIDRNAMFSPWRSLLRRANRLVRRQS